MNSVNIPPDTNRIVIVLFKNEVERPEMRTNLDLLTLTIGRAHPNCQLLLDPAMMRRMFAGAINEITRWGE